MKTMIRRVFAVFGLAPAGQVGRLEHQFRQAAEKLTAADGKLTKVRADAETWRRRHEELAGKLEAGRRDVERAVAEAERAHAGAEHAKARAQEWKSRADALTDEKLELRARLDEAQRAAMTARDYLMATEAKLDLIEAAIQILDSRTRESAVGRS